MVEDFDGARVNPDWDALRVDALVLILMVAVVDVGVLGVEMLGVPKARLDRGPVFDGDRLAAHRHDEGEDEFGHLWYSSFRVVMFRSVQCFSIHLRKRVRKPASCFGNSLIKLF